MDAIRKMIEEAVKNYNNPTGAHGWVDGKVYGRLHALHALLDCYAALGGDVSQWRGEQGRLL